MYKFLISLAGRVKNLACHELMKRLFVSDAHTTSEISKIYLSIVQISQDDF